MYSKNRNRFIKILLANGISAAGTLSLLYAFAIKSDPIILGQFSILLSISGVFITTLDGITSQRIIQYKFSVAGEPKRSESPLRDTIPIRLIAFFGIGTFGFIASYLITSNLGFSLSFYSLSVSQMSYVVISTSFALDGENGEYLRSQLLFGITSLMFTLYILTQQLALEVEQINLLWAATRFIPLPFLLIHKQFRKPSVLNQIQMLREVFLNKSKQRPLLAITLQQILNGISSQIDGVFAGLAGFAGAASYQIAQRPMAIFGLINVSISQYVLGHPNIRVLKHGYRELTLFVSLTIAWSGLALLIGKIVNSIFPTDYLVPEALFILLGLGYGFSAYAAFSGPILLLHNKNNILALSATAQFAMMILLGTVLTLNYSIIGLGIAFAISKFSSALVQVTSLKAIQYLGK